MYLIARANNISSNREEHIKEKRGKKMKIYKRDKRTSFEKEVDSVLAVMSELEKNSKEYSEMLDNLKNLCESKSKEKDRRISWDTILVVGGNILGILLILGYEKTNIVASKALGFVLRGRV